MLAHHLFRFLDNLDLRFFEGLSGLLAEWLRLLKLGLAITVLEIA
jgi:hypothetical protein